MFWAKQYTIAWERIKFPGPLVVRPAIGKDLALVPRFVICVDDVADIHVSIESLFVGSTDTIAVRVNKVVCLPPPPTPKRVPVPSLPLTMNKNAPYVA